MSGKKKALFGVGGAVLLFGVVWSTWPTSPITWCAIAEGRYTDGKIKYDVLGARQERPGVYDCVIHEHLHTGLEGPPLSEEFTAVVFDSGLVQMRDRRFVQ